MPVFEDWHRRTGIRILDHMGSTEMLHAFIGVPRDDIRPGSTGSALPGYHDGGGRRGDEPGAAGHGSGGLRCGPDRLPLSRRSERQKAYVKKGWNITGDAFHADEDGFYWYHSRTDDMIVSRPATTFPAPRSRKCCSNIRR